MPHFFLQSLLFARLFEIPIFLIHQDINFHQNSQTYTIYTCLVRQKVYQCVSTAICKCILKKGKFLVSDHSYQHKKAWAMTKISEPFDIPITWKHGLSNVQLLIPQPPPFERFCSHKKRIQHWSQLREGQVESFRNLVCDKSCQLKYWWSFRKKSTSQ